jgi:periodic tryptophan protein 2
MPNFVAANAVGAVLYPDCPVCAQLPAFENIHMLSMSRQSINAAAFSPRGDWIALGCAALGQLLVWEWRSESYVLKQQGHFYDVSAVAFSPDGSYIATGADDNKACCKLSPG